MQLSGIGEYLLKYRKTIAREEDKRSQIVEVIKNATRVSLEEKAISIKKGVLSIDAHTVVKNEIFMHKQKILSDLKNIDDCAIFDIR